MSVRFPVSFKIFLRIANIGCIIKEKKLLNKRFSILVKLFEENTVIKFPGRVSRPIKASKGDGGGLGQNWMVVDGENGSVCKCYISMTPKIELQAEIVDNFWQDSEYPSVNVLAFMVHYWVIFILSSFHRDLLVNLPMS